MFKEYLKRRWLFEADKGGSGGSAGEGGTGGDPDQGGEKPTFDAWIARQPDDVKALLEVHTKGLKSALDSERENRKELEKQLRGLAKKAEDGSEAQQQLTEMADKIAAADRKADFYEEAHRQGVTNLKLAYLTATTDGLIDTRGRVNFDEMKKNYPELFGKARPAPAGNAGNGTNQETPKSQGMNDFIRTASGRQP